MELKALKQEEQTGTHHPWDVVEAKEMSSAWRGKGLLVVGAETSLGLAQPPPAHKPRA